jgi:hypothetical protein
LLLPRENVMWARPRHDVSSFRCELPDAFTIYDES